MEQYEAFLTAGQVRDLTELKSRIRATSVGMAGKEAKRVLSSLDGRIEILRRGVVTEEEIVEAQMESQFGRSIGPISDEGLAALGIVPDQPKKDGNGG